MKNFDLKKVFNNNKFVMVLALLIAVVTLFVVKILVVREAALGYKNVPVIIDLEGTAAEKAGLQVIAEEEYTVDVTISGNGDVIGGIKKENLLISAKTATVTKAGTQVLELEVIEPVSGVVYELSPDTISVSFDTIVSREFPVRAEVGKLTVADGFIQETPFVQPEKITVEGPNTDIEKIKTCVAEVDIKGTLQETVVQKGNIVFYDAENRKLEFGQLLTHTPQTVDVTIPVYKQKKVPLTFDITNVPDGFPIDRLKYKMSHTEITIATPNDAVDGITEWKLSPLDFRRIDVGSRITLDVGLPSSYRNVDNITQVVVEFPSEGMSSKTVSISNLTIANAPENYNIQLITRRLNVKVVGAESIVKRITAADIVASVDLKDITVTRGQFSVPVKLSIPNKGLVWVTGEHTVVIQAIQK